MDQTNPTFVDRIRQVTGGFRQAKIVLLGIELEVFERLEEQALSAAELAHRQNLTERGTTILLDALVTLGLLTKSGGRYTNCEDTSRYLVRSSPDSIAFILGHYNEMFHSWARLDDIIRHGQDTSERQKATLTDERANRNFILGMAEVSRERLGPLVDHLPLEGARRLVDLGGGPAHYTCEAARRHPALQCVLVDLPLTVKVAREYIARQGLSEQVTTQVCDFYFEDPLDLGGPADVVLISQVLHAEGADQNRALLQKVAPHVRSGGSVVVVEHVVDESRTHPATAALFAVNMLAGTERGSTYTEGEIRGWMVDAGLEPGPGKHIAERTWMIRARKP